MAPLPLHRAEREALCDLFLELGPDAPTLCEGWDTIDLAGHLYVREHSLKGGVGIIVSRVSDWHDDAIARTKDASRTRRSWRRCGSARRSGRSACSTARSTCRRCSCTTRTPAVVSTRRPDRPTRSPSSRPRSWTMLHRTHRFTTMKVKGVHLDLVNSEHPDDTIHCGHGDETVQVVGRPGEIILYLLGRTEAAHVELVGTDAAVATLEACSLGI